MAKTRLILVRHGETYLNRYNRMQGWSDSPLTKQGKEKLEENAESVIEEPITLIYSSDTIRTQETSLILKNKLDKNRDLELEIVYDPRLREICFGSLESEESDLAWEKIAKSMGFETTIEMFKNKTVEDIYNAMAEVAEDGNAEDYNTFYNRITEALKDIADKHPGESILIVTHGNVIRTLFSTLSNDGKPIKDVANGQSFILNYKNGSFYTD